MRTHRIINVLVVIAFLFGFSTIPALSATSTSTPISPASISMQYGSTSGSVNSLSLIQQSGTDDTPSTYVLFTSPSTPHISYSVFTLPSTIPLSTISAVLFQANFKGPDYVTQVWTWSIYNWSTGIWIPIVDSVGIPANQWNSIVIPITSFSRYVSPTREIRIQFKSNNQNGDAKLDYEALHFTYVTISPTATKPSPTSSLTKAGYTFPATFTPTMTFTPTKTFTPTLTFTPTQTFTPTKTFTPTDTRTPTATRTATSTRTPTRTPTTAPNAMGPLKVSTINPRYFEDPNGNVVYLTGSHTWCDFIDCGGTNPPAAFNYSAFLDFITTRHHNFFRLWRAENSRGGETGDNFWFSPMPYQRSTTCCGFDNLNKFDLTKFNQTYFDRMRLRIIAAGNRGIYVSVMLFDGWSVESKIGGHDPWAGHPYNQANNVNSVNGDGNGNGNGEEVQTLNDPRTATQEVIIPLEEAYVRKVIDTVHDLDNVLYEISNESTGSSANTTWQYHMINFVKNYELTTYGVNHPVGMTKQWPNASNSDLFSSPADWIAPDGDINNLSVTTGSKVVMYDTDHLCGICGDRKLAWESLTRGGNPLFMDPYDGKATGRGAPPGYVQTSDENLRYNLGYALTYANRIDLAHMTPQPALSSSGYCLAKAVSSGAQYLVYLPTGGTYTVNLSAASGTLTVEWFNPSTGATVSGGTVNGGSNQQFSAPFQGDAVLYIYDNTP